MGHHRSATLGALETIHTFSYDGHGQVSKQVTSRLDSLEPHLILNFTSDYEVAQNSLPNGEEKNVVQTVRGSGLGLNLLAAAVRVVLRDSVTGAGGEG